MQSTAESSGFVDPGRAELAGQLFGEYEVGSSPSGSTDLEWFWLWPSGMFDMYFTGIGTADGEWYPVDLDGETRIRFRSIDATRGVNDPFDYTQRIIGREDRGDAGVWVTMEGLRMRDACSDPAVNPCLHDPCVALVEQGVCMICYSQDYYCDVAPRSVVGASHLTYRFFPN
jgi:hypothetical protein